MNEALSVQDLKRFTLQLFDGQQEALNAAEIMAGRWATRSVSISEIARHMPGSEAGNARGILWFLRWGEPGIALNRLYHDEAPFIVLDVTEIARPQAMSTACVGRLKDGNLAGSWLAGCKEPLLVVSNIEAKAALQVYLQRMKIEEFFRDLKSLLHVDKVVSKTRKNMES